jgi:hypothetical protein
LRTSRFGGPTDFEPDGLDPRRGDVRAEAALGSGKDKNYYLLNAGVYKVELSAMRIDENRFLAGSKTTNVFGLQLGVLPETTLTPGIGIGVVDITNQTSNGRGYYVALSKRVPWNAPKPFPLRDIEMNVGFGGAGIKGPFIGAKASVTSIIRLYGEGFNKKTNWAVGLKLLKGVEARASLIDGKAHYGLQISTETGEW